MAKQFYTTEGLQAIAEQNTWIALLPEIGLVLIALALLCLEIGLSKEKRSKAIIWTAVGGQTIVLLGMAAIIWWMPFMSQMSFGGMIQHSVRVDWMRLFFLLSSLGVSLLAIPYLQRRQLPQCEFFHLILLATVGLMLLVQSGHFVMLFVALELVTVSLYILVAYCRQSSLSLEAGIKYLVLGAASSAILLFGIVLLYAAASNPQLGASLGHPLDLNALGFFIDKNPNNTFVLVGTVLVIAGIAFKIGAVPFHIWVPDVYQGAPTPVTAFLAVASKAGGIFVLYNLLTDPFLQLDYFLIPLLSLIAIATIILGNLSALPQHNVKRLMGLSGVAHAGYLIMGVTAAMVLPWTFNGIFFYLIAYLLASLAVFGVMSILAPEEDADQNLYDYRDLAKQRPFLAVVLTLGIGSLAGIPPLAGFVGKVLILYAAWKAELYLLFGVALVGVVLSMYYYFKWILAAWNRNEPYPESKNEAKPTTISPQLAFSQKAVMGAFTIGTLVLGLYQGMLYYLG